MKEQDQNKNRLQLLLRIIRFKNYLSKNYNPFRKRIIVYLVFVFLATLLWFYRALDDTFITNINYPVRYQNLPKNKILISTPPEKVALKVRGNGRTLLSNKIWPKKPLNFNINSFLFYSQTSDSMSVYILTQYAKEALSEELNKKNVGLEIVSIAPDSIFFSFTRTRVKRVPILPTISTLDNICARQHMLNGNISLSPDSLDISGPANLLDTINYLTTTPIAPTALSDTFIKKLKILKIDNINIPQEKTILTIPIDKFTETGFNIPILTKHVPDSINMKLFPRNARVSFNITHSNYTKISETDFKLYVNYNDIVHTEGKINKRITIQIDSIPSYVHSFSIYPSSVEFINELNYAKDRNNRGDR